MTNLICGTTNLICGMLCAKTTPIFCADNDGDLQPAELGHDQRSSPAGLHPQLRRHLHHRLANLDYPAHMNVQGRRRQEHESGQPVKYKKRRPQGAAVHGVDDSELPGGSRGRSGFEGGGWSGGGVWGEFKLWKAQWVSMETELGDWFQGSYICQVPA